MTWFEFGIKKAILRCAAIFAAHFVCLGGVAAQEVTFRSEDNAVVVAGRFVAFDGVVATVATDAGPVSFRTDGMICEDAACPDLEAYLPTLRIIGPPQIGDVLMPALIEVYARDQGWSIREVEQAFEMSGPDDVPAFTIQMSVADTDTAFQSFVANESDVLLSMRELGQTELESAAQAGLGRLNTARQGRILALDALVPVASPTSDLRAISMGELAAALAGRGDAFDVQLPVDGNGQLRGFEDRFMRPAGLRLALAGNDPIDQETAIASIELGPNGLSLLPFTATGNTQPLALTGPCGLRSDARFLALKTEDYPLTFPIFLYLPLRNQHPRIVNFLDWLRSPSAQLVIRRAGFVDLAAVPIPLSDQGDRLANAIANAGEEIPLIEIQRLVRVLSPRVRMSSTFRFEPGSTRLDGQSRSNVMQLAQAIRDGRFGGKELMLVGFSDGRGPAVANRDLSAARAEAVMRDVQRALGNAVPANVEIEIEAFGEALPMACDDTLWGQQTNRRVELWVRDVP